ncbi:MAG: F0F1 ATP synthase subunit B [Pseudomonadota bacterium]
MFISQAIAAETAAAGGESGAFPPFDPTYFASQLLWLTVTFGIFYMIMNRVIIPRVAGILEGRHDRISRDLDETQRLKAEADAAQAAYEHELAEAKKNAHSIALEATEKAKAEAAAAREKVEEELSAKLAEAEAQIAEIKTKAMGEVGTIAADTTTAIVKELIGGTVTKADVTKAVTAASS